MSECTDHEIEMLARFIHDAAPPTTLTFEQLVGGNMASMRRVVGSLLDPDSVDTLSHTARATASLMRDASATRVDLNIEKTGEIRLTTGALDVLLREAREQGAAEMLGRAVNFVRNLDSLPNGDGIALEIQGLPLTSTPDERDRLDAEIAAVERSDQ